MLKQVMEIWELLDSPVVDGEAVAAVFRERGAAAAATVRTERVHGPKGYTDFIEVGIPGTAGRVAGGAAPTLGIIGQLGGIGARPERLGLVSDGDGALVSLAAALKLLDMAAKGDRLPGDVLVTTHICPHAPTVPHEPVPFMGSPLAVGTAIAWQLRPEMDAVLSVDTTRGNRLVNHRGFAISPTVKEGYVLRVSEDLLNVMQWVTGKLPVVLPITTQDITPYGNDVFHINSIMQPCTGTAAPVVGVALTAESAVPGCATGANSPVDAEEAARFCVEVAKDFGSGHLSFYDRAEFDRLQRFYGPLNHLVSREGLVTTAPARAWAETAPAQATAAIASARSRIGAVTIGQAPRTDVMPAFTAAAGVALDVVQAGALDGLSLETIRRDLAPGPADRYFLVSRLRDGTEVTLSRAKVQPLLQKAIDRASAAGSSAVVVLCTGEFEGLTAPVPLLTPETILSGVVGAVAAGKHLGVLIPLPEQVPQAQRRWERLAAKVTVEAASPYGEIAAVQEAARKLAEAGVDLVALDCIGFGPKMKDAVAATVNRPVFLPQTLIARIASEMAF